MSAVRFFVGPMSKNVVDAVIEFCDANSCRDVFGLIPSRRQVDGPLPGYSNKWTTAGFADYVGGRLVVQRDHAGPGQGAEHDDGVDSLKNDVASGVTSIHVDPWKPSADGPCDVTTAALRTCSLVSFCDGVARDRSAMRYEIGTERSIRRYDPSELREFVSLVKRGLSDDAWSRVEHVVVQTGTGIVAADNVDEFDREECAAMVKVCRDFGKQPKEHSCDYLSRGSLLKRIEEGVCSFNIAPEFGVIETCVLLRELLEFGLQKEHDEFVRACVASGKWKRWVDPSRPHDDIECAELCGHYLFSEPWFVGLRDKLMENTMYDWIVRDTMARRLEELLCLARR